MKLQKIKASVLANTAAVVGVAMAAFGAGVARADFGSSTVSSIFTTFIGNISDVLVSNLPVVLVVAAGLIGLGILLHYVRKWVGRK